MEKRYIKLGWNIKCLREAYRLTEEELGKALGVTRQAICNYETGSRAPIRGVLVKLADYFRITEDQLIYGDFSNITYPGTGIEDNEAMKAIVSCALPIISNEMAVENNSFKAALASHEGIYEELKNEMPFSQIELEKCLELYETALEDGVVEAAANLLWWRLLFGIMYSFYDVMEGYEDLRDHRISEEAFLQRYYLKYWDEEETEVPSEMAEVRKERRQFLRENEDKIRKYLDVLKHDPCYSDLADYYLALRYLIGTVDNCNSDALNKAIGEEMMRAISSWGNQYAHTFLGISKKGTCEEGTV